MANIKVQLSTYLDRPQAIRLLLLNHKYETIRPVAPTPWPRSRDEAWETLREMLLWAGKRAARGTNDDFTPDAKLERRAGEIIDRFFPELQESQPAPEGP